MAAKSDQRCAVGIWLLSALLLAVPQRADAEELPKAQDEAPPEAKSRFERGREHFRAGRYREAIVELKAALELDPGSPTLMYNIAYSNELLGELEEAIVYYHRYLDALPEAKTAEREKIRVTLRRLEGHRAQVEAAPEPEPEAPSQPAAVIQPAPAEANASAGIGRADVWFWASLGGGVAMLGGAVVTGLMALDREDKVAQFVVGQDGSIAGRQQLLDESDRLALTSDLLIGTGAALVTAAALLFFLRSPEDEHARTPDSTRASLASDGRAALLVVSRNF